MHVGGGHAASYPAPGGAAQRAAATWLEGWAYRPLTRVDRAPGAGPSCRRRPSAAAARGGGSGACADVPRPAGAGGPDRATYAVRTSPDTRDRIHAARGPGDEPDQDRGAEDQGQDAEGVLASPPDPAAGQGVGLPGLRPGGTGVRRRRSRAAARRRGDRPGPASAPGSVSEPEPEPAGSCPRKASAGRGSRSAPTTESFGATRTSEPSVPCSGTRRAVDGPEAVGRRHDGLGSGVLEHPELTVEVGDRVDAADRT